MHANTLCHIHFGHMTYSKFLFNESFTFDLFNPKKLSSLIEEV